MKHWVGILVGFSLAITIAACGSGETHEVRPRDDSREPTAEGALASKKKKPKQQQEALGPDIPSLKERAECEDVAVDNCMSYRITLLGEPKRNSSGEAASRFA